MEKQPDAELLKQTGPGTVAGEWLRRFWLPFARAEELSSTAERPVRAQMLGEYLVAFRDENGQIGLIDGICPHARADMFWGWLEGDGVRCAYHGWKFDVNGTCLEAAQYPGSYGRDTTAYATREHGGMVWAYLGPPETMPELQECEWNNLPESQQHFGTWRLRTGLVDAVDRTMDAHESADASVTPSLVVPTTVVAEDHSGLHSVVALIPVDETTTMGLALVYHSQRPLSTEEMARAETAPPPRPIGATASSVRSRLLDELRAFQNQLALTPGSG